MGPVLVDVRPIQGGAGEAVLRAGRAALPGRSFVGLADPALPALPGGLIDTVCSTPHDAASCWPECFVMLDAPADAFAARLMLDAALPSVMISPAGSSDPPPPARYWRARASHVISAEAVWPLVAGLRRGPGTGGIVTLSPAPDDALGRALQRLGVDVAAPSLLPVLSPRYRHTVFVLPNRPESATPIAWLRRYGGSAVLPDACLLAAYDDAAALAAAELGRDVPAWELAQWRAGIARPGALLLAEVAASADRLFVFSEWLAREIARRYGRTATVLPPPRPVLVVRVDAAGLQAECCAWAVTLLAQWGIEVRLDAGGGAGLPSVAVFLAMRGERTRPAPLGASGVPCIVSECLAESMDLPGATIVPDQPSPVLLAEAILAALPPSGPDPAAALLSALP